MSMLQRAVRFINSTEGSLNRQFIRATFLSGISSFSVHFISLVRSMLLARLLFPQDFGILASATIFVKLVDTLTQTGLATALIQRKEENDAAFQTVFTINIARGLVLASVIYFFSKAIADFYNIGEIETIIKILSLSLVAKSFRNINIIRLQKNLDYKDIMRLACYGESINFVVTILLALTLRNAYALALSIVSGHVIDVVLSHVLIRSSLSLRFDLALARELFRFGKFVSGIAILVFVTTEIDNFVIGKMLGMETLGIYVIAYTLANLPCTHLVNTLSGVITPAYCKVQDDRERFINTYKKVLKVIALIIIPASVGIYVLSRESVTVLYGAKWLEAGPMVSILVLYGALRAIASTTGPVFISLGKPDIPFTLILCKLVAIALFIVPATYFFGVTGTCWTISLSMLAEQFALWTIVCRMLAIPFSDIAALLYRPAVAATLMALYVEYSKEFLTATNSMQFLLIVLSGAAVYTLAYVTLFYKDYAVLKQTFSS